MKTTNSLSGNITAINGSDTRFGRRVEARIETINWSTGEVHESTVLAWRDQAFELEQIGTEGGAGMSGYWKKDGEGNPTHFNATSVAALRHIDPSTIDVSKYL